jgi:contactin associated protein-like 2
MHVHVETGAWSARSADYSQYLEIDLGDTKNITALATQGRQDSQEYVTAFTLSTAQDGILFSQIKGPDGSIWVSQRSPLLFFVLI